MSIPEQQDGRVRQIQFFSTASIVLERLTQAGWRAVCWSALFVALWLFEIPASFGQTGAIACVLLFLFGLAYFIRHDALRFQWPSAQEVQRRIERSSHIPHRPLSGLSDTPVGDSHDPLWRREMLRRSRLLTALRPYFPQAFLARQDPRALRLGVVLMLFCAVIVAGAGWQARLYNGFFPLHWGEESANTVERVSVWITPPEYTAIARIIPDPDSDTPLEIPQGSLLKVVVQNRLEHLLVPPSISIDGVKTALNKSEDGAYVLEYEIPEGSRLDIHTGVFKTIGWDYHFIRDTTPLIEVSEQTEALPDGQIRFDVGLLDDYGVQTLDMRMTLDPAVADDAPPGWPAQEQRSVMSPAGQAFQISPVYDLSAHPWAGLPVVFTFTAHDHLDQISQSKPIHAILPERHFTHPVAQQLVQIRKELAYAPESNYGEPSAEIEALSLMPQHYNNDTRIFLALRVAAARLFYNAPSIKTTQSVMALLWDIALRLEDGDLSLAARDLRDVQKQLEEALKDPNVSDEKIAFLMQKLREAMSEYMQAMAREWQKRMAQGEQMPAIPPGMMQNMMNMNDLATFLDKMESDFLSGNRNAAQDMLSKLQRLLDMTNPSTNSSMPQDMQTMMEAVNKLQDMIDKQEALLQKTGEQAEMYKMLQGLGVDKDEENEEPPFINTQDHATKQEDLLNMLQDLIQQASEKLPSVPENFGAAEQAMQSSLTSLGKNRPDRSVPFQEEAIRQLKDAQQQMAQKMAQRMQQMTGFSLGGMPMQLDPLGRPYGGQDGRNGPPFGSQVKIPTESEQKRVQKILNELRRRASERNRPREELEYYRRLLKRF